MRDIYKEKTFWNYASLRCRSFLQANALDRISMKNQAADFKELLSKKDSRLWQLHSGLNAIRQSEKENYRSYNYGHGYYYQSFANIGVRGFRDTEKRVEQLGLRKTLAGKNILDIGTNSGFLLLSLAKVIKGGFGIDVNPYLIATADLVRDYQENQNIKFQAIGFEEYLQQAADKFDCVLSLANHSTYDGNTKQNINSYFQGIHRLLEPGGMLIFESHPPQLEPEEKLELTLSVMKEYFVFDEIHQFEFTGFLDKSRIYVFAEAR